MNWDTTHRTHCIFVLSVLNCLGSRLLMVIQRHKTGLSYAMWSSTCGMLRMPYDKDIQNWTEMLYFHTMGHACNRRSCEHSDARPAATHALRSHPFLTGALLLRGTGAAHCAATPNLRCAIQACVWKLHCTQRIKHFFPSLNRSIRITGHEMRFRWKLSYIVSI